MEESLLGAEAPRLENVDKRLELERDKLGTGARGEEYSLIFVCAQLDRLARLHQQIERPECDERRQIPNFAHVVHAGDIETGEGGVRAVEDEGDEALIEVGVSLEGLELERRRFGFVVSVAFLEVAVGDAAQILLGRKSAKHLEPPNRPGARIILCEHS